jgi:N-carbamoyl-L-amino-acid hydrolase
MTVTDIAELRVNAQRLLKDFNALSEIGATHEGGVSRLALSNEDLRARAWLADRFEEAGIFVRDDDAGNLSGVIPSENAKAKTLLIGSHLDTVPNGGRYDSSVGVLAALESLRTIHESGIKLPVHLEAINFTDEEGSWQSLFGSCALTGKLNQDFLHDRESDHGPFRAALFRAGIRPADVHRAKRDPDLLYGYIELHIEQGRRLYQNDVHIGVVTGVVGRTTYVMTFIGEASHSGTTAREDRRDALRGAASFITEAFRLVETEYPMSVFNCGSLQVSPGSYNIIPQTATLVMECRHTDEARLTALESALIDLAQEQTRLHNLAVNVQRQIHMPAVTLDPHIIHATETACQRLGIPFMNMISYAGHDAQIMSSFTPSGMIFIPSVKGISHSPREFTEWDDVVHGADVLLHTILEIAYQGCD